MTKLELLYAQKSKKFDEVCALVARELGYSELPLLSDEDRSRVEDEAKQYVEQWEETVEIGRWCEYLVTDACDDRPIALAVVADPVPSRIILECRPPRLAICKRIPREHVG